MVNRGKEKVRVHMNVVPRSTRNTNSGTENLTLKCKFTLPTELQGRTEKVGDDFRW